MYIKAKMYFNETNIFILDNFLFARYLSFYAENILVKEYEYITMIY